MARGFKCNMCEDWYEGEPASLGFSSCDAGQLEVRDSEDCIEFYLELEGSLDTPIWRSDDDLCIRCRNIAIIDGLRQYLAYLQDKVKEQHAD